MNPCITDQAGLFLDVISLNQRPLLDYLHVDSSMQIPYDSSKYKNIHHNGASEAWWIGPNGSLAYRHWVALSGRKVLKHVQSRLYCLANCSRVTRDRPVFF